MEKAAGQCRSFVHALSLCYACKLYLGCDDVASSHAGRPSSSSSAEANKTGTPKKHPFPNRTCDVNVVKSSNIVWLVYSREKQRKVKRPGG